MPRTPNMTPRAGSSFSPSERRAGPCRELSLPLVERDTGRGYGHKECARTGACIVTLDPPSRPSPTRGEGAEPCLSLTVMPAKAGIHTAVPFTPPVRVALDHRIKSGRKLEGMQRRCREFSLPLVGRDTGRGDGHKECARMGACIVTFDPPSRPSPARGEGVEPCLPIIVMPGLDPGIHAVVPFALSAKRRMPLPAVNSRPAVPSGRGPADARLNRTTN